MKVVILTNGQGNQKALCHKVAEHCNVAAIILSDNIPRRRPSFTRRARILLNRLANRTVGRQFIETWFALLHAYDEEYRDFPEVPIIRVRNVNDQATLDTLEKFCPNLSIVSGTNLVGKKVIQASENGIVNLHTGISPYVKGGPNCTNWCLAKNWFHLIGNTVMWLDLGIDTGNIIATEQTPLEGDETLFELHWKVMQHAHDLYVRAIRKILDNNKVPSVSQKTIAEGNDFFSIDWNAFQMRTALINFRSNYKEYFSDADKQLEMSAEIELFPLKWIKIY